MLNLQAQLQSSLRKIGTFVGSSSASIRVVIALSAFALSSCAYHSGFGERQIPGGYKSIAVPVFKNLSAETGIEVYFTNAFIRELERAHVGTVTSKSDSQVTVEGVIDEVRFQDFEQTTGENINLPRDTVLNLQYRVVVGSTLRLRRNSDQKVLWEGQFTKEQTYRTPRIGSSNEASREALTSANALYNHSARYQNIQSLAADMMAEAHDRLTENF